METDSSEEAAGEKTLLLLHLHVAQALFGQALIFSVRIELGSPHKHSIHLAHERSSCLWIWWSPKEDRAKGQHDILPEDGEPLVDRASARLPSESATKQGGRAVGTREPVAGDWRVLHPFSCFGVSGDKGFSSDAAFGKSSTAQSGTWDLALGVVSGTLAWHKIAGTLGEDETLGGGTVTAKLFAALSHLGGGPP